MCDIDFKTNPTGDALVIELKNLSSVYKYLTLSRASLAASVILASFNLKYN